MRLELLYNPRLLCERLAIESVRRRRLASLRGTPGGALALGHIDTLELLELTREVGINVIYDIGANIGTWILLAKSVIPSACIHAFEPLPKHQTEFLQNFTGKENVALHPIAVGSRNATGTLHITGFSDSSSLLQPNDACWSEFGVREVGRLPLQVFRLDDYRSDKQIPLPDLIKLDIQGSELEALRGGPECLMSAKAVVAEVSFIEYYEGQCLFHDMITYLAQFGLFARAFGASLHPGKLVGQTDVLFMRGSGRTVAP
jgi:FkbM family methyltransferase